MWLFWIVWACVCAPVSLHLCVCMRAHTHIRLSASAYCMRSCARLRLCVCAAVSNSALTAVGSSQPGCDLSVYLSTFSLSFCFIFFFSQSFSSKSLCSASLFWSHFIFSSSLLPCLFFFSSVGILLPLYPDALSIPPSELFHPPFSFEILSISHFTLAGFHLSAILS